MGQRGKHADLASAPVTTAHTATHTHSQCRGFGRSCLQPDEPPREHARATGRSGPSVRCADVGRGPAAGRVRAGRQRVLARPLPEHAERSGRLGRARPAVDQDARNLDPANAQPDTVAAPAALLRPGRWGRWAGGAGRSNGTAPSTPSTPSTAAAAAAAPPPAPPTAAGPVRGTGRSADGG